MTRIQVVYAGEMDYCKKYPPIGPSAAPWSHREGMTVQLGQLYLRYQLALRNGRGNDRLGTEGGDTRV